MIARLLESQSPGEGKKWKILMGNKEKSRRFREKPNSVTNPSSTIRDPAHCSSHSCIRLCQNMLDHVFLNIQDFTLNLDNEILVKHVSSCIRPCNVLTLHACQKEKKTLNQPKLVCWLVFKGVLGTSGGQTGRPAENQLNISLTKLGNHLKPAKTSKPSQAGLIWFLKMQLVFSNMKTESILESKIKVCQHALLPISHKTGVAETGQECYLHLSFWVWGCTVCGLDSSSFPSAVNAIGSECPSPLYKLRWLTAKHNMHLLSQLL